MVIPTSWLRRQHRTRTQVVIATLTGVFTVPPMFHVESEGISEAPGCPCRGCNRSGTGGGGRRVRDTCRGRLLVYPDLGVDFTVEALCVLAAPLIDVSCTPPLKSPDFRTPVRGFGAVRKGVGEPVECRARRGHRVHQHRAGG
jgi:hypothetical protein